MKSHDHDREWRRQRLSRSTRVAAVATAWLLLLVMMPRLEASGIPTAGYTHAVHLNSLAGPIHFQESFGLDPGQLLVEDRHGSRNPFSSIPTPGVSSFGKVMLVAGVLRDESGFRRWYEQVRTNPSARATITIRLLDEQGVAMMTWELARAWPSQVKLIGAAAGGGTAFIEYLELTHEGLTMVDNRDELVIVAGSVVNRPLNGATVDFMDRQGRLLASGRTDSGGGYAAWVAAAPPYRAVAHGGTLGGVPYRGVLEAWCDSAACDVTPWTTVVVRLMDAHGFNAGDARAMLATAVGLNDDPFLRLAQGGSVPAHAFDPAVVRRTLDDGAGLSTWVDRLVAWLVDGGCPIPPDLGLPHPSRCGDPPAREQPPADTRPPVVQPATDEATCADGSVVSGATTPTAEFVPHKDGSVTHTRTGLIWDRCLLGQVASDDGGCQGEPSLIPYREGGHLWDEMRDVVYVGTNMFYRGADVRQWRMPTRDQLATIVERRCSMPAVNAAVFPNVPPTLMIWSSPAYGGPAAWSAYGAAAWSMWLATGEMFYIRTSEMAGVRLVRETRGGTAASSR